MSLILVASQVNKFALLQEIKIVTVWKKKTSLKNAVKRKISDAITVHASINEHVVRNKSIVLTTLKRKTSLFLHHLVGTSPSNSNSKETFRNAIFT